MKKIIALFVFSFVLVSGIYSQQAKQEFALKALDTVNDHECGLKINLLQGLLQLRKADSIFVVISHLGVDEESKYGKRRLFNLKTYFTRAELKYSKPEGSVIVAEGEKATGQGHVDIFADGELALRIMLKKNRDLHLGPCALEYPYEKECDTSWEELFYPCKKVFPPECERSKSESVSTTVTKS